MIPALLSFPLCAPRSAFRWAGPQAFRCPFLPCVIPSGLVVGVLSLVVGLSLVSCLCLVFVSRLLLFCCSLLALLLVRVGVLLREFCVSFRLWLFRPFSLLSLVPCVGWLVPFRCWSVVLRCVLSAFGGLVEK